MASRIVVVGGGFSGLWAAASAARARAAQGKDFEIVLVSPDPFHTIRVRCYETDLAPLRLPLDATLAPIGVYRLQARVTGIDATRHILLRSGRDGEDDRLEYDRLILAPGSALTLPPVPIAGQTFDVDTYDGAARLDTHLAALKNLPPGEATHTAVVIGGGLVGIEVACELPERLRGLFADDRPVRVVLIDRGDVGADMGEGAQIVRDALARVGVDVRSRTVLAGVEADGVALGDGTHIPAATVIFATGMRASPLVSTLGVTCDTLGRVPVDAFMQVEGLADIYAAGDCASASADAAGHKTVMSCQHARPMGRLAGHNAACDLMGRPEERIAFSAPDYVTILDLGPAGALYTEGWERGRLVACGSEAKAIKQMINGTRIYPPRAPDREAVFEAATPVIQSRPAAH
ncbi:NADH dehydrogenase [Azorhizobium oxalatiphilum]|uniref:NADH dehydrogenase n=1 Tax=Azorhizobium oxalatiphilum TaxID=980631 RepID=A0A917BWT9_9HYPH|nr:FAD-dependent oxidoreductase [Azorhizobium oxalatiphilum]GGF61982.1 NADH dehydrogenase [Azorhizobium oxalatiphilum]